MVSKAIISLFFTSFANLQVNGCFNEVLRHKFESLDKNADGVFTRDETCAAITSQGGSGDDCNKVWTSIDLNKDGKATCQELLIGILALDERMERELGPQLRIIFADKPDNCEEIAKEELNSLLAAAGNEANYLEKIYGDIDVNNDFIITCNEILENLFMSFPFNKP